MLPSHSVLLLVVVVFSCSQAATIKGGIVVPTFTEPCKRNSPDFDVCVKRALQGLMPKISKGGIPELELESIDPLKIPEILMAYDAEHIKGSVTVTDTVTRGISKLKITDVRSIANDPDMFLMEIDFFIPKMVVIGLYRMQGEIGGIPVSGGDKFNISMTDLSGTWKLIGSPVTDEDGEMFMKIDHFSVRPQIGGMKVSAKNLFHGNPDLSAATLSFINRFWKVLYEETIPYAEQSLDGVFTNLLNKVFLKIPYNQLFPLQ